jgi:chromosome segregation ATPase
MLEVIQSKIAELEQKITQETGFVAQLRHNIKQAREQVKARDGEIHKLRGAIEAFAATCNAMQQGQPQQAVSAESNVTQETVDV